MAERARGLPRSRDSGRAVRLSAPRAQREGLPLLGERAGGEGFMPCPFRFWGLHGRRSVFESVALAGDSDDLGVVQESVEDGPGGRNVLKQFAPVFEGTVAGHDGGAGFVAAHYDFQQILSGMLGQLLQSHVINDEQVGFEVTAQQPVAFGEGLFRKKVGDQIEDGAIADGKSLPDGFVTDGLGEVGLADSGRTDEQYIGGLADEVAGGQFVDVIARNRRVEPPVKVIELLEGSDQEGQSLLLDLNGRGEGRSRGSVLTS